MASQVLAQRAPKEVTRLRTWEGLIHSCVSSFPLAKCEFQLLGDLKYSMLPYCRLFLRTHFKSLILVLETLSRIYFKENNKQHTLNNPNRKLASPAASATVSTVGLVVWDSWLGCGPFGFCNPEGHHDPALCPSPQVFKDLHTTESLKFKGCGEL